MREHMAMVAPRAARGRTPAALADVAVKDTLELRASAASSGHTVQSVTLESSDISFILERLKAAEPVLCSEHALKALLKGSRRQYQKSDLLRLFEFATGRSPHDSINDELSDLAGYDDCIFQDAEARGNRLQHVRLPPDYDVDGLYEWNAADLTITHRYTGEEITLDETTISEMTAPARAIIYSNWSETSATLKVPGTSFKIVLGSLFKNQKPCSGRVVAGASRTKKHRTSTGSASSESIGAVVVPRPAIEDNTKQIPPPPAP